MTLKEKILSYVQSTRNINKHILKMLNEATDYDNFKIMLIENNLVSEEELLLIFSKEFRIPFLDLKNIKYLTKIKIYCRKIPPLNIKYFLFVELPACSLFQPLTL